MNWFKLHLICDMLKRISPIQRANELNTFFNRFSSEMSSTVSSTSVMDVAGAPSLSPTTSGDAGPPSHLSASSSQVKTLNRIKVPGPDGVRGTDQLYGNRQHCLNSEPEPGKRLRRCGRPPASLHYPKSLILLLLDWVRAYFPNNKWLDCNTHNNCKLSTIVCVDYELSTT